MGPGFRRDAEKSGYRVNVPVVITEAGSDSDIETARDLFRAYAESLPFSLDFRILPPSSTVYRRHITRRADAS